MIPASVAAAPVPTVRFRNLRRSSPLEVIVRSQNLRRSYKEKVQRLPRCFCFYSGRKLHLRFERPPSLIAANPTPISKMDDGSGTAPSLSGLTWPARPGASMPTDGPTVLPKVVFHKLYAD